MQIRTVSYYIRTLGEDEIVKGLSSRREGSPDPPVIERSGDE